MYINKIDQINITYLQINITNLLANRMIIYIQYNRKDLFFIFLICKYISI